MAQRDHARRRGASWFCLVFFCAPCGRGEAADDPLPVHALAQIGSYQFYHGPGVSATISPDGSRIASVAGDEFSRAPQTEKDKIERIVVLWDAATGQRVRELPVPYAPAATPRFSPNGTSLAVGYGREDGKSGIAIFDVVTGKLQKQLDKHSEGLSLAGFTPDGKSLVLHEGYGESLVWWDIQTAKQVRQWKRLEGPSEWIKGREHVCEIVPSANTSYIASLVDTPPDYSKFKTPPGRLVIIPPYIPRPTVLVMSDGATGKPLYRKLFPDGHLNRFVFSADGQRFATGGDRITFWETATGKELFTLDAESPYSFILSPDGRWAIAHSGFSQVRIWNLESKKLSHELLSGRTSIPAQAEFSADGKSVVLVTHSTIRLFDTATGKERLSLGHRTGVTPRFSADGKTLFTTCDELRQSWDVTSIDKPTLLKSEPRNAWEGICGNLAAGPSFDGRLFLDDAANRLRIRDTATGRVLHTLEDDGWSGSFAVFSSDGARVALRRYLLQRTPDGGITMGNEPEVLRLYDTSTAKKTGEVSLRNRVSWVVPVFSPDGKTLAWADLAADVHLHNAVTGKFIQTLHSEKKFLDGECTDVDLLFSPDGEHLIASTYQHEVLKRPEDKGWLTLPIRVFHVPTAKEVSRFYSNPGTTGKSLKLSFAASSPDGRLLAIAEKESGTVRLFDALRGNVHAELAGHRHGVRALAFSPDGQRLASGGEDGVTYLWDVTDPGPSKVPGKKDGTPR